jgi:transcriptional regulator with GAF, ATPase, and Fis domain
VSGSDAELDRRLARLERELAESRQQQAATSQVLGAIAASPGDVEPVLAAIVESAARLCCAFDAVIRLREGDALVFGAHYGPLPIDPARRSISRDWVLGRAFVDRVPIQIGDLSEAHDEFPEGSEMARRLGHRTTLAVPLLRGSEAIGAIAVRRIEARSFSDTHVSLLKTFADQAVIAIENARLFEEVNAHNQALTESLEQQTATSDFLRVIS